MLHPALPFLSALIVSYACLRGRRLTMPTCVEGLQYRRIVKGVVHARRDTPNDEHDDSNLAYQPGNPPVQVITPELT